MSPSFRFSVFPHVRFFYFIGHIAADNRNLETVIHSVQAYRSRLWWLFPSAVLCGLLEIAGWSGRLWSSQNPFLFSPYVLQ